MNDVPYMRVGSQSSVSKQSAEGHRGLFQVPGCPSGCLWKVTIHRLGHTDRRGIDCAREMTGLEAAKAMWGTYGWIHDELEP